MNLRAAERKRKKTGQAVILLAAVALGVAFFLYYRFEVVAVARPLDSATNCPTDGNPPAAIIVVLLDTTDQLSAVQHTEVMNALTHSLDDAPQYAEFQPFTVGPAGDSMLRPLATVCNPGSGKGASDFNSNPRQLERRWKQRFSEPLEHQLTSLLNAPSADTSPILESIQNVSASVFDSPAFDHVPKQLIIVSDMVQNTPGFSQYRQSETFDQFKHTPYYVSVRPNLDGVDVSILYLRRADETRIQGRPQHIKFWRDYFTDAGVATVNFDSVNG